MNLLPIHSLRWGILCTVAMMLLIGCKIEPSDQNTPITPETKTSEGDPAETIEDAEAIDESTDEDVMDATAVSVNSEPSEPSKEAQSRKSTEPITLSNGLTAGFTESGQAYIGDINAPVVIEEYSDYQCPFCARFYEGAMTELMSNDIKNGDAVIIFYDFPLTNIHPQAMAASNASHCAGEESVEFYWEMHDVLFDNLGTWGVSEPNEMFRKYAVAAGVTDLENYDACVAENRYEGYLNEMIELSVSKGVRATPTFIINGVTLSGAQPYEAFSNMVKQGLAGELKTPEPTPTLDTSDIELTPPAQLQLTDNAAGKLGNADAKITIVEYTDYQCPFCLKHKTETMPTLLADYIETGRVNYELRDLPLENIHPLARAAAIGARCAGEQEQFWEMNDKLFDTQSAWGTSSDINSVLIGYATELSLDIDAYGQCLTNPDVSQAITDSIAEAQSYGITGTPFFVIDGYPLFNGAYPMEAFEQVIQMIDDGTLIDTMMAAQRDQIAQERQAQAAQEQQLLDFTAQKGVQVGIDGSYSIGEEDAPVVVVEYTDYQCPYCQRHSLQTFESINEEYVKDGLVRYVFKDFPLESIHPQARMASHSVRCAGDQGLFLEMHIAIFNGQQDWSGNGSAAELFAGYAKQIGADATAFSDCLASGQYDDEITTELADAQALGVRSTPTFMINGKLLAGAQPYAVFQQLINQEIELIKGDAPVAPVTE